MYEGGWFVFKKAGNSSENQAVLKGEKKGLE